MELERIPYTIRGTVSYAFDRRDRKRSWGQNASPYRMKPHIVFTFWDAPEYEQSVALMRELQHRFRGEGLPIGAGLFTRPMGDVLEGRDYVYDPAKLRSFFESSCLYLYSCINHYQRNALDRSVV